MQNGAKFEQDVNDLEQKIKAKRAILKEVLRSVEDDNEEKDSCKTRKYIRNILHCEISHPPSKNSIVSLDFLDSFRFDQHVVARIRVKNRLEKGDLTLHVSTSPSSSTCSWCIFDNEFTLDTCRIVSSSCSPILCVSIPFTAFFQHDKITLIIHCKVVETRSELLTPQFFSQIAANQAGTPPTEIVVATQIDINEAIEELELKSIEFVDEHKAVKTVQSMFTTFSNVASRAEFCSSTFRRHFPRFSFVDFDTWRLVVGADRFDGVCVVFGEGEESRVMAKSVSVCRAFLNTMEEKLKSEII
uniref:Uncharacterized protein n=1 Tax=Caenorhabditis japonica TaxID=281687 RepID=A0A8R1I3T7_CAEJA